MSRPTEGLRFNLTFKVSSSWMPMGDVDPTIRDSQLRHSQQSPVTGPQPTCPGFPVPTSTGHDAGPWRGLRSQGVTCDMELRLALVE